MWELFRIERDKKIFDFFDLPYGFFILFFHIVDFIWSPTTLKDV